MTIVVFNNFGGLKRLVMDFDSKYSRENNLPKRVLNVPTKYDNMEKGKSKNPSTLEASDYKPIRFNACILYATPW